jgi:hypothetical protein
VTGTPRPDGVPADTAGVPWAGRQLPGQPFSGDAGGSDPALAAALAGFAEGVVPLAGVVAALRPARVLVPVVAVLGERHPLPAHARGDLGAEMALVTLTGADGRRALPAFTALSTLARWDPVARPVPVESARAALVAVAEGCDVLVLDAAGPVVAVVPGPAVRALGRGVPWTPPGDDAELAAAVTTVLRGLPHLRGARTEDSGEAGLRVVLGVEPGLSREELTAVVDTVRTALAGVTLLTERAEALELTVLPA